MKQEIKDKLKVNAMELVTQKSKIDNILETLYQKQFYKEYIDISNAISIMEHIIERRTLLRQQLEQIEKNESKI